MLLWCSFPLGLQSCSNIISAEMINFKNRLIEHLHIDNEFSGGFLSILSLHLNSAATNRIKIMCFFPFPLFPKLLAVVWPSSHVKS